MVSFGYQGAVLLKASEQYLIMAFSLVLQVAQPITTFSRKFECRISCLKGNHASVRAKLLFLRVSKLLEEVK
jgi:hypothetical protein